MSKLRDVLVYITKNYPIKDHLSNARLTKIVYLSDWRNCLVCNHKITDIEWFFDNYGPFVWDVYNCAAEHQDIFSTVETINMFGELKKEIRLKPDANIRASLSEKEKAAIDHIIKHTYSLNWKDFISLVYSTYPIQTTPRYTPLNLEQKAQEYKSQGFFDAAIK